MKTKLFSIILIFGLLSSYCFSQDSAQAVNLKLLLANASEKNKDLFLVFGWENCSWCRLMDKYHADVQVRKILDKYFLISYVDINKTKEGQELFKKYGKGGTPSWTIFNPKGEIVVDSDNGEGNVGYPATEEELGHYVVALRKAIPGIPQSECDFLVSKLKEHRNSK
jgi:thioredoxin-related protein